MPDNKYITVQGLFTSLEFPDFPQQPGWPRLPPDTLHRRPGTRVYRPGQGELRLPLRRPRGTRLGPQVPPLRFSEQPGL